MTLSADDDFLDIIAHQARLVHAARQLNAYQSALQRWQEYLEVETGPYDHTRVQYELTYYTQQVERWQEYLRCLGLGPL